MVPSKRTRLDAPSRCPCRPEPRSAIASTSSRVAPSPSIIFSAFSPMPSASSTISRPRDHALGVLGHLLGLLGHALGIVDHLLGLFGHVDGLGGHLFLRLLGRRRQQAAQGQQHEQSSSFLHHLGVPPCFRGFRQPDRRAGRRLSLADTRSSRSMLRTPMYSRRGAIAAHRMGAFEEEPDEHDPQPLPPGAVRLSARPGAQQRS